MYLKICSPFLAAVAFFTLTDTGRAQSLIGWNYDGVGDDTLLSSDLAGAPGFEQTNWNNHAGVGQGPADVPFALLNNAGGATGMNVTSFTLFTSNSWQHNQNANPNQKLMNSFADQQPSIRFSNIPASFQLSGYTVVVYYGNNEGPSTSILTLSGSVNDLLTRSITTGNTAQASYGTMGFLQETGALSGPTNYTVFTGLNDPELTVALTNGPGPSNNNNGISAIQFVAVPEPTSFVLVALGAAALGLRRRRP